MKSRCSDRCSLSRRALLTPLIAACVGRLVPLPAVAVEEESPLVRKLLLQTKENRELNAWRVRVRTEQNAYQAISGEPGVKQLVTLPDGRNAFYDTAQIAAMTREGRLLCPTGLPCRERHRPCTEYHNRLLNPEARARLGVAGVVEREQLLNQQLQVPKTLQCDEDGRRCKFRELLPAAEPVGAGDEPAPTPSGV